MKKNYLKKIVFAFVLLWSLVSFSQGNPYIYVSYGSPAIDIPYNGTISFGSSTEIVFTIKNIPTQGNSSLIIQDLSLSNSNFIISSQPSQTNIKRTDICTFKLKKNNFTCNASPQSTVVTINSNSTSNHVFIFTITFTNKAVISVIGGTPSQPVPNGQITATSTNGTLFGTVDISAYSTRNYVIVNTGTCPLTLGTLSSMVYPSTGAASPDFVIYVPPTPYPSALGTPPSNVILPGGAAYFVVMFHPVAPGTRSATISIPNDDATKNPYTFVVSGDAYNPAVTGPGGVNADFRLWLKATRGLNLTSGAKVPLWKDLGSTGKDASQAVAANQPTFIDAVSGNINYNPVIQFKNDGTSSFNQYMNNTVNGYYTQETFIVMEPDGAIGSPMTIISGTSEPKPAADGAIYPIVANEHSGIGLGDFTSRLTNQKLWFNQWQSPNTSPFLTVADASGDYTKAGIINSRNTPTANGIDLLFNCNAIGSKTNSASLTYTNLGYNDTSITPNLWKGTPYNIGKNINSSTGFGNLNGRVAEIISYASRVPDTDRPKIETYLAIKYGITLGVNGTSKNYVDSGGNTIWNIGNNTGFNYNITGIGRDIGSDLYQKQSKSINDNNEVSIGLGVIAATNGGNTNQFTIDRNFLVWGSDNGLYTASADVANISTLGNGITTSTTRINKKWKIVETGGDVANVFVGIPATAFNGFSKLSTEEYVLIVSDNANFSDADIIDVIPLKINIDVYGNPILNKEGSQTYQTWYDFDGTKFFTFGKTTRVENKQLVNFTTGGFLVGEYALNLNSGSFTVSCWIRNDGSSLTNKTIIAKGANLEIRINAQNKVEALWDGVSRFVSNTAVADGKWHYIVGIYYQGAADLYIDGVIDSSTFNLQNPTPNYSRFSTGALYIDKNNITNPFLGEIDEVQVWDMALSSNQLNYLMNQEIVKHTDGTVNGKIIPQDVIKNEVKPISWSTLKAYYDFNVFYGTTVEGMTNDRNFLRIKYLNKNKQIINTQTAPLPYETVADGLWSNPAIWKNGSLQTLPNDNSIISQTPQPTVNGNIVKIMNNVESIGNKTVLGLFVNGTDTVTYKTLTANNNSKVEVSHYLKLDGLIDLKGKSQLVQTLNSELDPTSKGFIKRDQQGTVNKFNYNYWSSPVGPINPITNNNNYSLNGVNGVFKSGTTSTPVDINWVSGYDGSTSPLSLARYWLYKFENGTEYANWIHFNENDLLLPSQGFTVKGDGATNTTTQNYTFVGKPYNGLLNGNSVLPDNLFLVGNPYPSALDGFKFIKDNISIAHFGNNATDVIDGTLYFWQHSPINNSHYFAEYTGGYATLTLIGGVSSILPPEGVTSGVPTAPIGINGLGEATKLPYQYIPVGQGFFVNGQTVNIGSQPIVFNNNQRSFVKESDTDDLQAPISNTLFKRSPTKSGITTVDRFTDNRNDPVYNNFNTKIRLGFNTANKFHRQLLIGFMNDLATDGLDVGYDGYQIDTQSNDSYFLINDLEYTIQGVGGFDVNKTYPLGVKTNVMGNIQFLVDGTEFLPANQKIYIHDKETAKYYDISVQAVEINLPIGTYNDRFELTFKTEQSLAVKENILPESMLLIYNNETQKKLFVTKNQSFDIKEISVYNIIGQQLLTLKKVSDLNTVEIPFNVERGVYLIKVTTDKGVISKKVLKK